MRGNVVTLVGNLGADPDYRRIDAGTEVTNLRVGCTERRQDRSTGEWVDGATSWWRVSCWRGLAANTAASLRKGDRVVVTGTVRVEHWEREGRSGTSLEVVADAVGHDLAWGRSRFERVVRSQSLPLPAPPAAEVAASFGGTVDEHGVLTGGEGFGHGYVDGPDGLDEPDEAPGRDAEDGSDLATASDLERALA